MSTPDASGSLTARPASRRSTRGTVHGDGGGGSTDPRSSIAEDACFGLASSSFTPTDHLLWLEGLGEHAVATDRGGLVLVDGLKRTGEQHDRDVRQPRRLLDVLGHLVAVSSRHADVGQHDVRRRLVHDGDRLLAIAHRDDLDVLVGKRQLDHAPDRHAVVGEE